MIYQIPIRDIFRIPARDRDLLDDDKHLVDWNEGIDVRVDWNGDKAHPGTFEALCGGEWRALEHVSPGSKNEQLAAFESQPVTCVRVVRGPEHAGTRFAAKLVPIVWTRPPKLPEEHDVEVERGIHYEYAAGAAPEWVMSEAQAGVHGVKLEPLVVGQDYEMWVRLWHPDGSDDYQDQDPVIRTGGGGGGSED